MYSILIGCLILSLLHAIIPNHWLPILAIGKKYNWNMQEVSRITFISGMAHAISTIALGVILGLLGLKLADKVKYFTHFIAPVILVLIGILFIYQHHWHKHVQIQDITKPSLSKNRIITGLVLAMFLSPCLEIEAYFLLAGSHGMWFILAIALMYVLITVAGMMLWVWFAYNGILKLNWQNLEHISGLIAGWTLIITGMFSFFIS